MMLRECIRHEPLAKHVIEGDQFYSFFTFVELSTFDIASDAFSTFKVQWAGLGSRYSGRVRGLRLELTLLLYVIQDLLTRHKILCAQFLEKNYDKVNEARIHVAACHVIPLLLCRCLTITSICSTQRTTSHGDSHSRCV